MDETEPKSACMIVPARESKRKICLLSAISVLLVGLAVAIPTYLLTNKSTASESDVFRATILSENITSAEALDNPDTPQAKAFSLVVERKRYDKELYALAVVAHGLSGVDVEVSSSLLSLKDESQKDKKSEEDEEPDHCSFNWVTCNEDYQVKGIMLYGNDLSGSLLGEAASLKSLERLVLSHNGLAGTIPKEMGGLSRLEILDLSSNNFQGTLAEEVWNLTSLRFLDLKGNANLEITIPENIADTVPRLGDLDLGTTSLIGSLPTGIGALANLESFDAFNARGLTGTIPAEIGNARNLRWIDFKQCLSLEGTIPTTIGMLDELKYLSLSNTKLRGTIPTEIGNARSLKEFYVLKSRLTGTIPTEFGRLTNTTIFAVRDTDISGTIPTEFASLTKLLYFDIDGTKMTGNVPVGMSGIKYESVNICAFDFGKEVPQQWCDWCAEKHATRCVCCDCPLAGKKCGNIF